MNYESVGDALIEWYEARRAIFDEPLIKKSPEHWARLSVTEHKLMDIAEQLRRNM